MRSIFITGLAGMLGSNLAYLLRDKYRISGVDLNKVTIRRVTGYAFSALDLQQIREVLLQNQVDILIHCAALVNVDECELNPEYAYLVNTNLTEHLTRLCEELNITMIFISTDAVFDGREHCLYQESDTPGPISVYGKTKLEAEKIVRGVPGNLVVRTNIYGFNYREKNSFGEWILNALISHMELNMFHDIFFSPLLVNELAGILDQCIARQVTGLYHICSTGSISKYEIAIALMEEFGFAGSINKVSMEDFEFKAPRTKNMGLSNERISRKLGIHISTPREGVSEFKRLYDSKYQEGLRSGQ